MTGQDSVWWLLGGGRQGYKVRDGDLPGVVNTRDCVQRTSCRIVRRSLCNCANWHHPVNVIQREQGSAAARHRLSLCSQRARAPGSQAAEARGLAIQGVPQAACWPGLPPHAWDSSPGPRSGLYRAAYGRSPVFTRDLPLDVYTSDACV